MQATTAELSPRSPSFQSSLGRFLVVTPKGKLLALDDVRIAEDYSKVLSAVCPADFHTASTVALRLEDANLRLVLRPGEQTSSYFVTRLPHGKPIRMSLEATEIVQIAVENGRLPVIVLADLKRRLARARARTNLSATAPIVSIPVRYLVLRPTSPKEWVETISELFLLTAQDVSDKAARLTARLDELNSRIRRSMIGRYLSACLWIDDGRKQIGQMLCSEDGTRLRSMVRGTPQLMDFIDALSVGEDGRYECIDGVASVVLKMVAKKPWTAPTLHIHDEATRCRLGLKEYYSLYAGLRALCVMGAPVLVQQPGGLGSVISVCIIKTRPNSDRMPPSRARVFPIHKVVWIN